MCRRRKVVWNHAMNVWWSTVMFSISTRHGPSLLRLGPSSVACGRNRGAGAGGRGRERGSARAHLVEANFWSNHLYPFVIEELNHPVRLALVCRLQCDVHRRRCAWAAGTQQVA
jgi:hypothetical protein